MYHPHGFRRFVHRLAIIVSVVLLAPGLSFASSAGPPDAKTGAPGHGTCHECHNSFDLNSGAGSFSITAPATFLPGGTYEITIAIDDPGQTRWGFEFSPLDQGTCTITDPDSTQLSITGGYAYVKHTAAGTNAGSTGPMVWRFDWTAPSTPPDTVVFYAAGNAANNNNRATGDYVYTAMAQSIVQDTQAPNAIGDLRIEASGTDLILTWSDPGDNIGVIDYLVYTSPFAHFDPAGPVFDVAAVPSFIVTNGAGDTSVHHFFNVRARDAATNLGPPSNYVGEMEFAAGQ